MPFSRAPTAIVSLAVLTFALGLAPPADACSCAVDRIEQPGTIPKNGKLFPEEVLLRLALAQFSDPEIDSYRPLNVEQIEANFSLVRVDPDHAYSGLGGAGGAPQPANQGYVVERAPFHVTLVELDNGWPEQLVVFHPAQELTPGEWQLTMAFDESIGVESFTVVNEVDHTPPETPVIESVRELFSEGRPGDSCGDDDTAALAIRFSSGEGFLLFDGTADERYAGTALEGPMTAAIGGDHLYVGQIACGGGVYRPGEKAHFRVRRVDWAGNVSDWSEPADATVPEETPEGCLCSFPGAMGSATWPSAALASLPAAVWLLRRRRRSAASLA